MKLMKLFVLTSALLLSVQAFADVGRMSKDEIRDGTLVCLEKLQKEVSAHKTDLQRQFDRQPAESISAQ